MAETSPPGEAPAADRSPLRGAARRQAILDTAIELIGEMGYERITVDAIAAHARASKATMYRHWPGKAELVADALRRHAQGDAPSIPDTGSLRGDLLATVGEMAGTLTGLTGPSLMGLLEAIRDDATLRDLIASQVRERSHEVGRTICTRGKERGDAIRVDRSGPVLDVAFARVFTDTLFHGGIPESSAQEQLVDEVLIPLLRA